MIELPEAVTLAKQFQDNIRGKTQRDGSVVLYQQL